MFRATDYMFSKKVGLADAFPEIGSAIVTVELSGTGVREWNRMQRLDASSLGEYVDCQNALCYGGGFSLGGVLRTMVAQRETHREDSRGIAREAAQLPIVHDVLPVHNRRQIRVALTAEGRQHIGRNHERSTRPGDHKPPEIAACVWTGVIE